MKLLAPAVLTGESVNDTLTDGIVNNMDWVHEAVFGFKEAGLKLHVTTWVPRFMQSVKQLAVA